MFEELDLWIGEVVPRLANLVPTTTTTFGPICVDRSDVGCTTGAPTHATC
jgi:hypothetical protein